jgi:hypothetical protein
VPDLLITVLNVNQMLTEIIPQNVTVNSVKDFSMFKKFYVQDVALLVLLVLPMMSVSLVLLVETIPHQNVIVSSVISLMVKTYVKIVTTNVNPVIMKMKETFLVTLVPETDIMPQLVLVLMDSSMLMDKLCVHSVTKFVILVLEKPLTV